MTTFETVSRFRVLDEATSTLRRIAAEVNSLNKIVAETQKNLSAIARIRLTGLTSRVEALTRSAGGLNTAFGSTFRTMETGTTAAIADVGALAAQWRAVATAATAASRATAVASRASAAATAGGIAGAAAGGRGGRHGPGVHVSSFGAPIPGGHANFRGGSTAGMIGAGALGYGIYEAAQLEDAAFRIMFTAGAPTDNMTQGAQYKRLREILQTARSKTGADMRDIEEAAHTEMRQFAGMPFDKRLEVLPSLLEASAAEARLKGHGTTVTEGMETFTGLAHMLKNYSPEKIAEMAPKIAYLSAVSPLKLKQIEGAAGYAVPILQGNEYDPIDVLLAGTALQRQGVLNTKSGTWLRELGARALPGNLAQMSDRQRERRMAAGRELGLLDDKGHATFLTNGRPDFMKVLDIASEHAAKIPIERRSGVERDYFGTQGAGALAVLGDPVVRAQITALKAELAEFHTGSDFFEKFNKESPAQQARTAFGDLSNVLTDLGESVLPPVTTAFRSIAAVLEAVKGNKAANDVTTAATGAAVGGLVGGPVGAAIGAAWGLGSLLNHAIDAATSSLGNVGNLLPWPGSPPKDQQPVEIHTTVSLDGSKVGESVLGYIIGSGKLPIGGSPYYDPSSGPVPHDLIHP
jgi:hypothetical protein